MCCTDDAINISENKGVALHDMMMNQFEMVFEREIFFQSRYYPAFA
jgi:hypothetical protein